MRSAGGILDRYVLVRMAGVYGMCVFSFILLFLVVDGFSRLDVFLSAAKSLGQQGHSVWAVAGRFYATSVPRILSMVGPYMSLFAGIATVLSLARTNEIVPMLTSGRSFHRVLAPVYAFGVLATGALVLMEERVVPAAVREHAILDRLISRQGRVETSKIPHLTDGNHRWALGRWWPREQRLDEAFCQHYVDPAGKLPVGTIEIRELRYRRHPKTGQTGWFPTDGVLVPAETGPDGRVLGKIRLPPDRPVAFNFKPSDIALYVSTFEEGTERAQLEEMVRRNPGELKWAMDLYSRTTRPLSGLVLLLLGIPFVATPEKRSIAWGLGLALFLCLGYFGTDFLFREIGMRGELHPLVAVWAPPILFTALALALMDRVRG